MKSIVSLCLVVFIWLSPCFGYELIVLGDLRSGAGNENFQKTEGIVKDAIHYTEQNYDEIRGIIMTGDYVSNSDSIDEWERFREVTEDAFQYPVYPCLGNHDDGPADYPQWFPFFERRLYYDWDYYQTFNVERWWSADIDDLHLVALDSNLAGFDFFTFTGDLLEIFQYMWFEEDLKKNSGKTIIVIWHEPAYGSHSWFGKGHGSNRFMRNRYVSLCEQYGVKMILCGHNHWYERVSMNGIKHITTGGAGAPLSPVSFFRWDKVAGTEVNIAAHHWCVISVNDEAIEVDVIAFKTHKLLDSFQINY